MKFYIVKQHDILQNYTYFMVDEAPWVTYDAGNDLECYYLADDSSTICVVADLNEDDLLVLTLSGSIVNCITSNDQLSRHILYKFDIL